MWPPLGKELPIQFTMSALRELLLVFYIAYVDICYALIYDGGTSFVLIYFLQDLSFFLILLKQNVDTHSYRLSEKIL